MLVAWMNAAEQMLIVPSMTGAKLNYVVQNRSAVWSQKKDSNVGWSS